MAEARILVVEDQAMVATALESLLVSFGYVVPAILAYGEEVLGQVDRLQPDLILMDISLQGAMDGVQAAQEVRTRYDLPIIYLTARSDTRTLERANITEPYGYILKPFEGRELQLTIEMALHKYRLERQIAESEELRAAAALSERQRIARDLHDTVSQTLLSAQMISSTLLRSRERDSDDFNGRLRTLDQMIPDLNQ